MSAKLVAAAALALAAQGDRALPPPADDRPVAALAEWAQVCRDDDAWDKPGPPFRIHGNTFYVGTCAIAAILIAGEEGHVLIDSGTDAGAQVVAANVEALGFRLTDVKELLLSHEHIDHAGGMARMQRLTGARLVTSAPAAAVMRTGVTPADDPQVGLHAPMAPVAEVFELTGTDGILVGDIEVHAIPTPGHTAGAMSWHWQSCEGTRCITIAYADSLSPVSRDDYRFSDHPDSIAVFRDSIARLGALRCDLLLTPHPSASRTRERLLAGSLAAAPSCGDYAAQRAAALDARLAREAAP
jgi:metallo-beta-lactamase class B